MNNYRITLLKGDGIGPEIVNQAVKVLDKAAEKFDFTVTYDEALLGGCAIDATGVPLPEETVAKCKASDSVLLGAVGGPKWDNQPGRSQVGQPARQQPSRGRSFGHSRRTGLVCQPASVRDFRTSQERFSD